MSGSQQRSMSGSNPAPQSCFNGGSLKRDANRLMKNRPSRLENFRNSSIFFEEENYAGKSSPLNYAWPENFVYPKVQMSQSKVQRSRTQAQRSQNQVGRSHNQVSVGLEKTKLKPFQIDDNSAFNITNNPHDTKLKREKQRVARSKVTFATEQDNHVAPPNLNRSPVNETEAILSQRKRLCGRPWVWWADVHGPLVLLALLFLASLSVLMYFIFRPEHFLILEVNSTQNPDVNYIKKKDARFYSKITSMIDRRFDPCSG